MAKPKQTSNAWEWKPWKGTTADLVEVADQAPAVFRLVVGTAPDTSIDVARTDRLADSSNPEELLTSFDDAGELASHLDTEPDPNSISRIDITVVQVDPHFSITITLSESSGARLTVSGEDRAAVRTVSPPLRELLSRGKRPFSSTVFAVMGVVLCFAWLFASFALFDTVDWNVLLAVAISIVPGMAMFIAFLAYGEWALPTIEFLKPGARSRWQKSRAWFLGVIGAVVVGLLSAALWDLIADVIG
jgi:hypothetical protein